MQTAIPFVRSVQDLFERLPREDKGGTMTIVGITSDKGLCGGVNTQVAKIARNGLIEEEAKGNTTKIVMMGGKGSAAMKRLYGDRFTKTFEEAAKVPWTFGMASIVAESIAASD